MKFAQLALTTLGFGAGISHADTVLITGANSGIGLEFATQYAARDWNVIATHRHEQAPEALKQLAARYPRVRIERIDVTDPASVAALAQKLAGAPIDVLINNAGVYAESDGDGSTQLFGKYDFALLDTIMAVNVKGPLIVSQALYANVKSSAQKKIVAISSTTGSLTMGNPGTNAVFYRASKAALNREMQVVSQTVRPDGVVVLIIHPGIVRTERIAEYARRFNVDYPSDALTPAQSVGQMIDTIAKATLTQSGRFLRYDGQELPW